MRIVSLLPAATEIVALLGASDHLVGVSHECDYPDIVGSRARVTRATIPDTHDPAAIDAAVREQHEAGLALFAIDEARVRALHPDVLLTQALCEVCAVRESDVRALASRLSPEPRVVTLGGTSVDGILDDIRTVGEALGASDEVEETLAGLRDRIRHVHETLKAAQAPRPRVALVEWTEPVYVAGHWGPEQIKRAGGIDVLGVAGAHSVPVSMDALREAAPDIVLFAPCGYSVAAAAQEARRCLTKPEWEWLADRQVWAMDANGLTSRPGPRVVDGIEAMARIFNPSLFTEVAGAHAVRVR
ncbi:ABC transporter substrate-binding protein [Gemmatimonas sp. UBA7669]|uniref:ABC transporter substrate-binding protein n=1 Tax=Gemmatimonas sp. UBA7669 TaxID=1946568 RepID=UPI0025C72147|nr:ABC transporter substrate-binding protein [Gemmatimonas sp. UBA7669]